MSEAYYNVTGAAGSWGTAQSFGFGARSIHLINQSTKPALVRWGSSGGAVLRLDPRGQPGSIRALSYTADNAPTGVSV